MCIWTIYSWNFLGGGGVNCSVLKSRPYFRPKNVIFHTRFQARSLKSRPVFRPGARFSKVPILVTVRARNQIFKSKYKE